MRTRKIRRQGFTFIELLAVLDHRHPRRRGRPADQDRHQERKRSNSAVISASSARPSTPKRLADEKRIEVEEDSEVPA
jgi:hypothetical protein